MHALFHCPDGPRAFGPSIYGLATTDVVLIGSLPPRPTLDLVSMGRSFDYGFMFVDLKRGTTDCSDVDGR
jgi:hypothetical protein